MPSDAARKRFSMIQIVRIPHISAPLTICVDTGLPSQ